MFDLPLSSQSTNIPIFFSYEHWKIISSPFSSLLQDSLNLIILFTPFLFNLTFLVYELIQ